MYRQAKSFPFAFTVEEMILLGRSSRIGTFGTPEKADRERCERAMEELGIAHMRRKLCNQISGGELQMVLIARALCAEPKLLVLDEPESNLDFRNQLIILETIRRLSREEGLCCIFNTHYPGHALRISDRALVLSREGYGRLRRALGGHHARDHGARVQGQRRYRRCAVRRHGLSGYHGHFPVQYVSILVRRT